MAREYVLRGANVTPHASSALPPVSEELVVEAPDGECASVSLASSRCRPDSFVSETRLKRSEESQETRRDEEPSSFVLSTEGDRKKFSTDRLKKHEHIINTL